MLKKQKKSFVSLTKDGDSVKTEVFKADLEKPAELNNWLTDKISPVRETSRSTTLVIDEDNLLKSLYESEVFPADDILKVAEWSIREFKDIDIELDSQEYTALSSSIKLREWVKKIKKISETS